MVDLPARHAALSDEVESRVLEVLRQGRWVGGPVVAEAEGLAAAWTKRARAVGVNSGTDALMIALQAVGVRSGDEVILPALSFFATAGAVGALGARPVIVDVDEDGLLDLRAAAQAMQPSVRAILPVHLFGAACPHPDLGVPVVDDLAQAVGGAGGSGVLGAISTYPTKTWGAAGDGGFIVGDDPDLIERAWGLANHGLRAPHLHHAIDGQIGRNSRLDTLQAAILIAHAADLPRRLARRRANADLYDALLPPGVRPLARSTGHAVHHYVIRLRERDRVAASLRSAGIETAIYYPRPLGDQPALQERARLTPCPVAAELCREVLALPVHAGLSEADVRKVAEHLAAEVA